MPPKVCSAECPHFNRIPMASVQKEETIQACNIFKDLFNMACMGENASYAPAQVREAFELANNSRQEGVK